MSSRIGYVLAMALFTLLVCSGDARAASGRVALVIGNGAYKEAPLANPVRDAALMTKTLRQVGFEVIQATDANRKSMQDAFVKFGRKLNEEGRVGLFYYAGHGVQVDGQNYLLPVDVEIRSEAEVRLQGINLNEVLVTLGDGAQRLGIAILDACRNNPFAGLTRGGGRGLAPVVAPAGTLIAFATAPGEVAYDGNGVNSPYTTALAQAIPVKGLAIEDVFKRTRQRVMAATRRAQVPWEHSSLVGRFVFAPAIGGAAAPAAVATPAAAPVQVAADEAKQFYVRGFNLEKQARTKAEWIQAAALYRSAADRGSAAAMRQLALLFDRGRGVSRNSGRAAHFILKALELGDPEAEIALAGNGRRWSRAVRRAIQRKLSERGHYAGVAHGKFDAATQKALAQLRQGGVVRSFRPATQPMDTSGQRR